MLRSIGSELHGAKPPVLGPKRARAWVASLSGRSVAPWMLVSETTRLVLLGGKGGVGKTTCAAALAISLARRWKERPVLLISVDPAHSLGDVLGQPVADAATLMAGGPSNLHVRELDAGLALRQFQARLSGGVDRLFDAADRSVVRGLIELAPPGLDELAAVLRINDGMLREAASGQLIVIDTAPSGHALRLLEMPALVQDWARALMSILLKYQGVVPLGEAGAALLDLSQAIGRLRTLLRSPELASFIAVTRPAALPRLETTRLLKQLRRLHLHVPWVIVNAVGRGSCRHCLRHARTQQTELKQIVRPSSERAHGVVVTPAQSPSPRGVAALGRWSSRWIDPPAGASRTPATLRYHRSR